MTLCDDCILNGRCNGSCGDTDPYYYEEQRQNDLYDLMISECTDEYDPFYGSYEGEEQ